MRESPVLAAPEFVFFGSVLLFEVKNSLSSVYHHGDVPAVSRANKIGSRSLSIRLLVCGAVRAGSFSGILKYES